MSMEIFVLSARRVSSIQQWQRSIDLMGISLTLSTKGSFAALRGTLPVNLGPTALYFECDHWDVDDLRRTYGNFRFEKQWKYALAMRWGGDADSGYAANIAAAGYALAVEGVIFDSQSEAFISPQRAIDIANDFKAGKSAIAHAVRMVLTGMKQKKSDQ